MMLRGVAVLVSVVWFAGSAGAEVPITTCGQTVPAGEVGVLQSDLACAPAPDAVGTCVSGGAACVTDDDCPAFAPICLHPAAVVLESRATLRMAGFALSAADVGVDCRIPGSRGCDVEGPGAIHGCRYGILVPPAGRFRLAELSVHDNGGGISNAFAATAAARMSLTLDAVTIASNAQGGLFLVPFGRTRVRGTDVTVIDNQQLGISVGLYVSSDPPHPRRTRAKFVRLDASGNANLGIYADRLTLVDSTVTGTVGGTDILSFRAPRLRNTACGTSTRLVDGVGGVGTWGVCSAD